MTSQMFYEGRKKLVCCRPIENQSLLVDHCCFMNYISRKEKDPKRYEQLPQKTIADNAQQPRTARRSLVGITKLTLGTTLATLAVPFTTSRE